MSPSLPRRAGAALIEPGLGMAAGSSGLGCSQPSGRAAAALLNLVGSVLILPGCGLACVVLGFYVLTTTPPGTVLWNLLVALAWSPVVMAAFAGVVLILVMLLIRFPPLVPVLLSVLGSAASPSWPQRRTCGGKMPSGWAGWSSPSTCSGRRWRRHG